MTSKRDPLARLPDEVRQRVLHLRAERERLAHEYEGKHFYVSFGAFDADPNPRYSVLEHLSQYGSSYRATELTESQARELAIELETRRATELARPASERRAEAEKRRKELMDSGALDPLLHLLFKMARDRYHKIFPWCPEPEMSALVKWCRDDLDIPWTDFAFHIPDTKIDAVLLRLAEVGPIGGWQHITVTERARIVAVVKASIDDKGRARRRAR